MIFEATIHQIEGPLRTPLIVMEWIVAFLFIELSIIFWIRVRYKAQYELKSLQEKAYIWLFLGYSSMWVFIIIADYYLSPGLFRTQILNIGFFIQIICMFIFISIMEKYKIYLKKRLFTKILTIMILFYIFIFIVAINLAATISTIFWIIFIMFFIVYLKELSKSHYIKAASEKFKMDLLKFLIGILLVSIGYQLTTRLVVNTLGLGYRLLGDIFQIFGLFFLSTFFLSIPSFSEFDWHDKIDSVYITDKAGRFLYKKFFRHHKDPIDQNIIAGLITSVNMMLQTLTKRKGVTMIEKEGKIVIIQPGKFISGIIICDEKLNSLQVLLTRFIEQIEEIFHKVLENWKGELSILDPIESIAEEIFF